MTRPTVLGGGGGMIIMSLFWNHILGSMYAEIAKIAATWKLAKLAKNKLSRFWGFETGTNIALNRRGDSTHYPTTSVSGHFFIYQTRIGYIWILTLCQMYEFIGHRVYEFNFLMYEFISGGGMCEVPLSLCCHLTHQHSISLLPRSIRVGSAAPTS